MHEKLLTTREAAERLGLAPATLEIWRQQGLGPPFLKLGAAVRYEPRDLTAYIDAARRPCCAAEGVGPDAAGDER